MKVNSATHLRQILKRGLTKVFNDESWPPNEEIGIKQGLTELEETIDIISQAHSKLKSDEAREAFEERLLQDINTLVEQWRDERKELDNETNQITT